VGSVARERIAVVGVGAIGGAIAADLSDLDRYELALCARSPFDRLEVSHPGGTSRVERGILTQPPDRGAAEPVDWLLLAVKAHRSASAKPWLDAFCGGSTKVAVLQNGVEHVERIAPLVAPGTAIVPVVIQLPAERSTPGRVAVSHNGMLRVPDDADGRAFAALFEGARTRVEPTADFLTQAWWKLVSNASLGGVCALALRDNGVASDPQVRELVFDLMREVVAVGRAEGAALPDDAAEKALAVMERGASQHWSSITVDRREGRPMEWEARNAVVGRLGRRHGIPTPLNDAVTTLLRAADVG
jgi:2-dehydropantoate 2-reductase